MQEKKKINSKVIYTITIVLLLVLTIGSLGLGAWALFRTKLNVNGRVTFNGTGNVLASVSNGKINYKEVTNKMQGFTIDNEYGEDTNLNLPTWKNLQVDFDEVGNDVPLTFTVTNNSEDKTLVVEMTSSCSTPKNVNMEVLALGQPYEDKVLISPTKSVEYMVLFSLDDVTIPGSIDNFSVSLNMRNARQDEIPTPTLEKLKFTLVNGTSYRVAKNGTSCTGDVVIPAEYNGKPVTEIAMVGFAGSSISSIIIPESITTIGNNPFVNVKTLKSISIPDSVTNLGSSLVLGCGSIKSIVLGSGIQSFGNGICSGCSNLRYINIPASVTSIDFSTIGGCAKLSQIYLDKNNSNFISEDNVIFNKDKTEIILYSFNKKNKNFAMPNSIEVIRDSAFSGNSDLIEVTFSEKVTSIGASAFSGCSNLKSVTIPNTVTSLGGSAFSSCSSLISVNILANISSIEDSTFSGCSSLKNVNLPSSLISIGDSAFRECGNLTSITIPEKVTSIEDWAFYDCDRLIEVCNLSNLDIIIGDTDYGWVASNAKNLCTKEIDKGEFIDTNYYQFYISKIGNFLIGYSGNERELTLPTLSNSRTYEINDWVFSENKNITSIVIPSCVTKIRNNAFSSSNKIIEVCNLSSLDIVKGDVKNGYIAYNAINIYTNEGDKGEVTQIGDYQFYISNPVNALMSYTGNETSITLPTLSNNRTYEIYKEVFKENTQLTSITIPEGVTNIRDYAFEGCSNLKNITIPSSVTNIDRGVFLDCSGLTSITLPNNITKIDTSTFAGCSGLTSIRIPEKVTIIGE